MDFRQFNIGDRVSVHCCDHCIGRRGMKIKSPADSRGESWWCELCGHFGIGSQTICVVGPWNTLRPVNDIP